jgi:hypothetical protein
MRMRNRPSAKWKRALAATNASSHRPTLHEKALRIAAEEAFKSEVVETEMFASCIGAGQEYATAEEWIEMRIDEWLERAAQEVSQK